MAIKVTAAAAAEANGFGAKESAFMLAGLSLVPVSTLIGTEWKSQRDAAGGRVDDMSHPRHLMWGLVFGILICIVRLGLEPLYRRVGRVVLSPEKRVSEDRVERFAASFFKFQYFVVITVLGYALMRDEAWLPWHLAGHGDIKHCWDSSWTLNETSRFYYMVQLGYHSHSLIMIMFHGTKRNDFLEMLVHHCCAILCMISSFAFQQVRIGSLILFVHDIGDVFGYAIKCSVDTAYKKMTYCLYALLLVAWGVTRLYIYPTVIIRSAMNDTEQTMQVRCTVAMLWVLQGLHVYWYTLFLKMGYQAATKGKTEDIQQQCDQASKKEA